MNENSKWSITIIVAILVFAAAFTLPGFFIAKEIYQKAENLPDIGSVEDTSEYTATTTRWMNGKVLNKTAEFNQIIATSTGGVTLGSVVVASTTKSSMNIYDATSTAAITPDGGNLGNLITILPTSTPQGTYTYDIILEKGLVIQLQPEFVGDYVITYRH